MRRVLLLGLTSMAILAAACSAPPGAPAPPSAPDIAIAVGLPNGSRYLQLDAAAGGCIGPSDSRLAVLEVATGTDFHAVLPGSLGTPELDAVKTPVNIVVYKDGWPGPITGRYGSVPQPPEPGMWDVCVSRVDGGDIGGLPFIVYSDVTSDGSPIAAQAP
jgi:hypothetical protein